MEPGGLPEGMPIQDRREHDHRTHLRDHRGGQRFDGRDAGVPRKREARRDPETARHQGIAGDHERDESRVRAGMQPGHRGRGRRGHLLSQQRRRGDAGVVAGAPQVHGRPGGRRGRAHEQQRERAAERSDKRVCTEPLSPATPSPGRALPPRAQVDPQRDRRVRSSVQERL